MPTGLFAHDLTLEADIKNLQLKTMQDLTYKIGGRQEAAPLIFFESLLICRVTEVKLTMVNLRKRMNF